MIDIPRFNPLSPQEQLATIAHECCHHIINNDFGEELREKYGERNLCEFKELRFSRQDEALCDFLVQDLFNIDIALYANRDIERKTAIKWINNFVYRNIANPANNTDNNGGCIDRSMAGRILDGLDD